MLEIARAQSFFSDKQEETLKSEFESGKVVLNQMAGVIFSLTFVSVKNRCLVICKSFLAVIVNHQR